MLSRPQDFAAIQEAGTTKSHALLSARFLRTDLETTRFGLARPAIVEADHDALVGALQRTLVRGGVLEGINP